MASCKPPEMNYTCEICGLEGFNDEEMRSHMVQYHLQGAANCPFCDLGEISPTEMLVHVNSAHLDYLTPRYARRADTVDRHISFADAHTLLARQIEAGSDF